MSTWGSPMGLHRVGSGMLSPSCDTAPSPQDELAGSRSAVLNCMALSSAHAVFPAVAEQLGLPTAGAGSRELARRLERALTAKGPML